MLDKIPILVAAFIKLRNEKSALERVHKVETKKIQDQLDKLEALTLQISLKSKLKSFPTEFGTAYRSESTRLNITDWNKAIAHVVETKDYSLLTKALSKTEVVARQEAGEPVPGVEITRELGMNFMSPRNKGKE